MRTGDDPHAVERAHLLGAALSGALSFRAALGELPGDHDALIAAYAAALEDHCQNPVVDADFANLRRTWSDARTFDAGWQLATALDDAGRSVEASLVYRELLDLGYLIGHYGLAWIEHDRGNTDAAVDLLERYLEELDPTDIDTPESRLVHGTLGHWLWHIHGRLDAEPLLRHGQSEYASARADLASLLISTGRVEEARDVLESWVDAGDAGCCIRLGNLHQDAGDRDAAARLYALGFERGDAHSARNLALMIRSEGSLDDAIAWMRRAADGGDFLAMRDLAEWEDLH